jgi:hypothetical protein
MAKKDGKAAIAAVIAAAAAAPAAEQLELMPAMRPSLTDKPGRARRGRDQARSPRPSAWRAEQKATREMLEFVRKLCGDPLERRFRYAMHTPETLAIELGCTKLEAFDRLEKHVERARAVLLRAARRRSTAGNSVAPRLTMVFPGQSAPAIGQDGLGQPPWMYIEQNQALASARNDVSHGDVSHAETSEAISAACGCTGR